MPSVSILPILLTEDLEIGKLRSGRQGSESAQDAAAPVSTVFRLCQFLARVARTRPMTRFDDVGNGRVCGVDDDGIRRGGRAVTRRASNRSDRCSLSSVATSASRGSA